MTMDANQLRDRVAAFPYWYHQIALPHGITTPGWAPLTRPVYRVAAELTGKGVIEVGAGDGCWT